MKLSLALFTSLILATTSLAAPRTSRNSRNSRRQLPQNLASIANSTTATNATNSHQNSRTLQSLPKKISTKSKGKATTSHTTIDYSSNWGGAIIQTPPAGQTFNAVSGAFQVPTPSIPPNGMGTGESFAAAVWVGIDGDTYTEAILQTGIDLNVAADGSVSFDAWYEWFPDYSYTFDIAINAGDEISMTVIASSGNEGTAIIENITSGDQAYINLSSNYTLGGQNAEWIVEDFEVNNELVAFADFGTVTFTNCVATTAEQTLGVESASIIEIGDSGGQLTGVDIVNANEVVVFWKSH